MSLLDDSTALDQTTPWAPTVPLAPPPTGQPEQPAQPAAQPAAQPGRITPETHPQYFSPAAPAAPGNAPNNSPKSEAGGDYMATVRRRESGGNDMASNGTAFGRYQFTPKTWLGVAAAHPELGLRPEDIWNGDKQDAAMHALTADNSRVLQKEGFDPTPSNLYMMHFLGTGGGPKFLKAMQTEPTSDAATMFPLEAKYNPTIFFHGGDPKQPRTLSQVYGMVTRDFGGTAFDATPTKSVENSQPQIASDAISDATNDAALPPMPAGIKWDDTPAKTDALTPSEPPGIKWDTPQDAYNQDVGSKNPYDANIPKGDQAPDYAHRLMANLAGDPEFLAPKSTGEFAKDELSGAAGAVAGAARAPFELFSGIPGQTGEASAEAARLLGKVGSPQAQTFGNVAAQLVPVGAGAKAAGTIGKEIVEEGPTLARLGRGAFEGARGGAGAGLMTPTDETDPNKRAGEKLKQAMVGGATGGVAGAAFPAIAGGGKWAAKELGDVWGGEARKLSEELRKGVNAETGKALTAEEKTAKLAQIDKMSEKKSLAGQEADTGAHQSNIAAEAAKPVSTPEALGEQVHETAVADMEKLKAERADKSGFAKALKSDGGAPSVPTKAFIDRVSSIEKTAVNPQFKADLAWLKDELKTPPVVKGSKPASAVSIKRMRDVLETLNGKIDELLPGPQHEMKAIRDDLVKHLEETHPQMKAARLKYAEMSRPLDVYERTGALSKAVMEDPYAGTAKLDPTKIKTAVTGRTVQGAEALQRLIEKNPAIKESVRNVLQGELYGSGATARTPTAANLRSFLTKNEMVLKKTGLDKEFEAIKPSLEAVEAAPGRARETQRNIEDLAKTKVKATAARSDIRRLEIEMNEPKNTPRQIVSAAESTAKKLYDRGSISEAQYQKFFSAVREAETKNADHDHAVRLAKMVGAAAAVGVMGEEAGRYIQHRVNVR